MSVHVNVGSFEEVCDLYKLFAFVGKVPNFPIFTRNGLQPVISV